MVTTPTRAAVYARVSTLDQEPENQLRELRAYVAARGWTAVEFTDRGVSGAKESRPALDRLMAEARRRKVDAVLVWSLDRFGRSLVHVVAAIHELHERGVAFVSLHEGLDLTTAAGRLQFHLVTAFAEFERARIAERVKAGLALARARGKRLGRPRLSPLPETLPGGLSVREAGALWGVSKSTAARRLAAGRVPGQTSCTEGAVSPEIARV